MRNIKLSKSRKRKVGNYRIERYKAYKNSDVCAIEVGCYMTSTEKTIGHAIRNLNSCWNGVISKFDKSKCNRLIWVPELKDSLITTPSAYCSFTVQFTVEGISKNLNEGIYGEIEDMIIQTIESSKVIVVDK